MGWRDLGFTLLERGELKTFGFYKAIVAEFLATMLFLFFTLGNVFNNCSADWDLSATVPYGKLNGECQTTSARVLSISFSFGVAIFVLVYATASFSGGHINPAVSIGLALGKRLSVVRACCYIIAQIAGAVVGAGLAKAINIEGHNLAGGAVNRLNAGYTYGAGWTMETILTFALVFMVYAATDSIRGMATAHLPVLAPLSIGMVVFLAHLVAIPIDNCSINPARSFGAAAIANEWHGFWLFVIGPLSGAILAALVYELLLNFKWASAVSAIEANIRDDAAKLEPYPGTEGLEANMGRSKEKAKLDVVHDQYDGRVPDTARGHAQNGAERSNGDSNV